MASLKERLRHRTLTLGSWITLAQPGLTEIMARAGFDWLVIDLEHSVTDIREAGELIRIIDLCGPAPLVRLTSNHPDQIKRVMDAGAHGIIVPMVNTRNDAERAATAMYYPPRGTRGVGLARAQDYGNAFADYRTWLDRDAVLIVQIEHVESVRNLEAILSLPDVDGYIIGPYDLSASMGIPGQLDHPDVLAALDRIRQVGHQMRKPGGIHLVEPDPSRLKKFIADGFTFIAYSVDIRMLAVCCRDGLEAAREAPATMRP